MWLLLVVPVVVVAALSVIGVLRSAPPIRGDDPPGLRTVVVWRDPPAVAGDIAGEAQEQLRQLVGALAEHGYILASSIDRGAGDRDPVARVDVRDVRLELRTRDWRAGRWILWVDDRGRPPADSEDLRQLLTGLYRSLESRGAEGTSWHRREGLAHGRDGAPSPFYVD